MAGVPPRPYGPLIETTMRVVTWNVWGLYGPWQEREAAISTTLHDAGPDILVLTESWAKGGDSQCARLAGASHQQDPFACPVMKRCHHLNPEGFPRAAVHAACDYYTSLETFFPVSERSVEGDCVGERQGKRKPRRLESGAACCLQYWGN
jgi:hypothetical protein